MVPELGRVNCLFTEYLTQNLRTLNNPLSSEEHHGCQRRRENHVLTRIQVRQGCSNLERRLLIGTEVIVVLSDLVLLVVEVLR